MALRAAFCVWVGLGALAACSDDGPSRDPSTDGGTGGGTTGGAGGCPSTGGVRSSGGAASGGATSGGAASGGAASGGAENPPDGGDATGGHQDDGGTSDGGPCDGGDGGDGDGGTGDGGSTPVGTLVESGAVATSTAPRPDYGAIVAVVKGARRYVVESRRDIETGPFNLPWRSRFRLAVYEGEDTLAWSFDVPADDLIGDVAVHPSGSVTISVQRHPKASLSYDLVRLGSDGDVVSTTTLASPETAPESDYAAGDPRPLFRMKSFFPDAINAGHVRLLPDGEGLIVAYLSYLDVPATSPLAGSYATGLEAMDFTSGQYVERWARVVDSTHDAEPGAWAYDELRWRDQAIRPFLARDPVLGEIVVARSFNRLRCEANRATYAEFTATECNVRAVNPNENEHIPLIVTRYRDSGERLGSFVIDTDEDAVEQVPWDLEARGGQYAVAGSLVRANPDGTRRLYGGGAVDYDGYIAIYGQDGKRLRGHDFNGGRGDVLAALRWTSDGIVAAGSAGWDRGTGGMSIGKGADPFFAWMSNDAARSTQRTLPMSDGSRHFNLHDVHVEGGAIWGFGISDAPMTHSADGNNHPARTFGPLRLELTAP